LLGCVGWRHLALVAVFSSAQARDKVELRGESGVDGARSLTRGSMRGRTKLRMERKRREGD
jgi:hypothetical protein